MRTLVPTASAGVILPDLDETTEHPIEVGWRVYPFPPVFWRRTEVQALNPELIYYGPLPQTRAALRREDLAVRSIGLSGGVANNRALREALGAEALKARRPFLAAEPKQKKEA